MEKIEVRLTGSGWVNGSGYSYTEDLDSYEEKKEVIKKVLETPFNCRLYLMDGDWNIHPDKGADYQIKAYISTEDYVRCGGDTEEAEYQNQCKEYVLLDSMWMSDYNESEEDGESEEDDEDA